MNIFASIALIKGIGKPHQPDPAPPEEITFGDTDILWGSTTVTFND